MGARQLYRSNLPHKYRKKYLEIASHLGYVWRLVSKMWSSFRMCSLNSARNPWIGVFSNATFISPKTSSSKYPLLNYLRKTWPAGKFHVSSMRKSLDLNPWHPWLLVLHPRNRKWFRTPSHASSICRINEQNPLNSIVFMGFRPASVMLGL